MNQLSQARLSHIQGREDPLELEEEKITHQIPLGKENKIHIRRK